MARRVAGGSAALRSRLGDEQRLALRFVLVGAWNTVFGYALFAALHLALGDRLHYTLTLLVSSVICTFTAYLLHRYWVFRVEGRFLGDLMRFSLVYVVAFLANLAALPLLVEVASLPVLLAQAIVVAVTVVVTFVAHRDFSFRRT